MNIRVSNLIIELWVDPAGIEPATLPCHGSMLPVYHGPMVCKLSFTNSHQELPSIDNGYIVPKDYYDKYPLVFSHYHLDRIIVRIGMNEKQRKAINHGRVTDSARAVRQVSDSWYSSDLHREGDQIQQQLITCEISTSHNMFN